MHTQHFPKTDLFTSQRGQATARLPDSSVRGAVLLPQRTLVDILMQKQKLNTSEQEIPSCSMQQLFYIAAKTLWNHCQSCQRELSQRAVHQTQVSLDQHSQEAEAQISLLGNSRIHQPPHSRARGTLNLCHHSYVQEVRKYSFTEAHSGPDSYLCTAAVHLKLVFL